MSKSIYDKIAGGKAGGSKGDRILDGRYVYAVKKLIVHQGFKGTSFIAELLVKESQKTRPDTDPNPVGSTVAFVVPIDKFAWSVDNVKTFICRLMGAEDGEVSGADIQELCGGEQHARGMLIGNETYRTTKKDGDPFTGNNWRTIQQTEEDIAKERAALDAAGH